MESNRSGKTSVATVLRASVNQCSSPGWRELGVPLGVCVLGGPLVPGHPDWTCSRKGLAYKPGQWAPQGWGGLRALKEWQRKPNSSIDAPALRQEVLGASGQALGPHCLFSAQGASASPCSLSEHCPVGHSIPGSTAAVRGDPVRM